MKLLFVYVIVVLFGVIQGSDVNCKLVKVGEKFANQMLKDFLQEMGQNLLTLDQVLSTYQSLVASNRNTMVDLRNMVPSENAESLSGNTPVSRKQIAEKEQQLRNLQDMEKLFKLIVQIESVKGSPQLKEKTFQETSRLLKRLNIKCNVTSDGKGSHATLKIGTDFYAILSSDMRLSHFLKATESIKKEICEKNQMTWEDFALKIDECSKEIERAKAGNAEIKRKMEKETIVMSYVFEMFKKSCANILEGVATLRQTINQSQTAVIHNRLFKQRQKALNIQTQMINVMNHHCRDWETYNSILGEINQSLSVSKCPKDRSQDLRKLRLWEKQRNQIQFWQKNIGYLLIFGNLNVSILLKWDIKSIIKLKQITNDFKAIIEKFAIQEKLYLIESEDSVFYWTLKINSWLDGSLLTHILLFSDYASMIVNVEKPVGFNNSLPFLWDLLADQFVIEIAKQSSKQSNQIEIEMPLVWVKAIQFDHSGVSLKHLSQHYIQRTQNPSNLVDWRLQFIESMKNAARLYG